MQNCPSCGRRLHNETDESGESYLHCSYCEEDFPLAMSDFRIHGLGFDPEGWYLEHGREETDGDF